MYIQNMVVVHKHNIVEDERLFRAYEETLKSIMDGSKSYSTKLKDLQYKIELIKFGEYLPYDFAPWQDIVNPVVSSYINNDTNIWVIQTYAKIQDNKVLPYLQLKIDFHKSDYSFKSFQVVKGDGLLKINQKEFIEFYNNYLNKTIPPPPSFDKTESATRQTLVKEDVFQKNFKLNYNKFHELVIEDRDAKSIPFKLFDTLNIRSFRLLYPNIQNIPLELFNMKSLRLLIIACKSCSSLPDEFYQLEHLTELSLTMKSIKKLPESIGKLSNLEKLTVNVSNEAIENIPNSFSNLKRLKSLNINADSLNFVPTIFSRLDSLKSLSISRSTDNKEKANCLVSKQFKNIKSLSLSKMLVEDINSFPNLNYLKIWFVDTIPENFFLGHQSIKEVLIWNKNLKYIPTSLFELSDLEKLEILVDKIESYPPVEYFLKLKNLKYISITDNAGKLKQEKKAIGAELKKIKGIRVEIY